MGKYIYRKKTVNDPVEFLSAFKNGYPYAYLEYSKEMEQPLSEHQPKHKQNINSKRGIYKYIFYLFFRHS